MLINGAELHLLINHFPVILPLVGCALFIGAVYFKSPDYRKAALLFLIVSGLAAWISYLTGDSAEDVVKNFPGTNRQLIHEHEHAAKIAWLFAMVLGFLSGVGLWVEVKKKPLTRFAVLVLLALSLLGFGLMARTAHLGGLIKHEEIRGVAP